MDQPDDTPLPELPGLPDAGIRTGVSLLLFIHLMAVAIAMTSGVAQSPTVDGDIRYSDLLGRMRGTPLVIDWLQLIAQDQSYAFALTQGAPEDAAHTIEVELETAGDAPPAITLPAENIWPPQRRIRHREIAFWAAGLVGDDNAEALLPQAIAARLVDQHQATGGTIRIRRHYFQSPAEAQSVNPEVADPDNARYFETIYEARILVSDDEVTLLKRADLGTTAPAAGAAAEPSDDSQGG